MTSLALGDLGGRLNEVRRLSRLDPLRRGNSAEVATGNAVNRACIVLLCAHLEGFLEDLAIEVIDALVDRHVNINNLPLLFRAVHAEEHLRQIEMIRDRNSRAPKIEHMFKNELPLWSDGHALEATMVRHRTVCAELSNPGSREIRHFLQLLGVDIERYLMDIGQMDLLDKVNGLVARRNSIAHGEVNASATLNDVDQYLSLVENLGRRVDEAAGLAVMRIGNLTSQPW
jgi:RiboL-PSP-HEPN